MDESREFSLRTVIIVLSIGLLLQLLAFCYVNEIDPPAIISSYLYKQKVAAAKGQWGDYAFQDTVDKLVIKNIVNDRDYECSFEFPNGTINMSSRRPVAFLFENGEIKSYTYYDTRDFINPIGRNVVAHFTFSDGKSSEHHWRIKDFPVDNILEYEGTIPLFTSRNEMLQYFRKKSLQVRDEIANGATSGTSGEYMTLDRVLRFEGYSLPAYDIIGNIMRYLMQDNVV